MNSQPQSKAPRFPHLRANLALFALLAGSLAANVFFTLDHKAQYDALRACARNQNVFACKFVATPTMAPRVVVKQAEVLPPFDEASFKE